MAAAGRLAGLSCRSSGGCRGGVGLGGGLFGVVGGHRHKDLPGRLGDRRTRALSLRPAIRVGAGALVRRGLPGTAVCACIGVGVGVGIGAVGVVGSSATSR